MIYILCSWKWNLLSAITLTAGLLLTSQQEAVSATSIPDKLLVQKSDGVTIPRQKLPSKLLPKPTLTQLPNPIPPRNIEPLEIPKEEPPPKPQLPIEQNPPETPSSPETPKIQRTITVKKFEFAGNTAFSAQELEKTVEKFLKRPISLAELLQVEEEIKNKYTAGCQKKSEQQEDRKNLVILIPGHLFLHRINSLLKMMW